MAVNITDPPEPMDADAAAWVREVVWTQRMRKTHSEVPDAASTCWCQAGPSGHCKADRHGKCWHNGNPPFASPETYVCGRDGTSVLAFAERFEHATTSATGPKRAQAAMVWLADRACRWRCPCGCHTPSTATAAPPAAAVAPSTKAGQLDLFEILT